MSSNESAATPLTEGASAQAIEGWMSARIATVLGVGPDEVDVDAPFVEHGLDSVAALQLTGELESVLGRPLDATLMFEYPTIAALSRHLADE